MRRTLRITSLLVAFVSVSGCSEGRYGLQIDFDDTVTPTDVRHIEVIATEGQCPLPAALLAGAAPTGTIVGGVGLSQSQASTLDRLGDLPPGTYALYARGFDASCAAIAAGCSVYSVKRGGSRTLAVTLTATNPMQLCTGSGICNDGACQRPDAGVSEDGGVSVDACLDHPCGLQEFCTDMPGNAPNTPSGRTCTEVTSCAAGAYQFSAPTPTSDRVCATCTACSGTQFESAPCANGNVPQNRSCTLLTTCTTGQYQSTAPTATSDRGCTPCTVCGAAEYQTTACANGNAPQDRACEPLTQCGTGFRQTLAPTATTDRTCAACASPCSNGQYESQACANGNGPADRMCASCNVACTSCDGPGTGDCTACPPNQFFNGASCQALTTCGTGQREQTPPTATSNRVCTACTVCGSEQYPSVACADGNSPQDRVCAACATCTASQYETVACTGGTTNRVCTPLSSCVTGQRQTVAPTATTNRTCAACTTCTASQHETVMCADGNTSQDRVCIENMGTCTLVATGDGETNNFSGTNTNTNGTTMRTSSDGATFYNAFIQFGVASGTCLEGGTMPANVTVVSATLSLTLTASCGGCSTGHDVRRVTGAWSEASLPVNGGSGPAVSTTVSATFSPPAVGSAVSISGAGIVSDVQFFLGNAASDFGFRISKSDPSTATGMQNAWATRNHATTESRPRLVITYMTN